MGVEDFPMARKPRAGKLDAGKLVREKARKLVGTVPASRVIPDKRKKPEKHRVNDLREAGGSPLSCFPAAAERHPAAVR